MAQNTALTLRADPEKDNQYGSAVVSAVVPQQEEPGFESWLVVWFSPPKIQRYTRFIGYSKLSICVNVSMNGCLSLYVSPVVN